MEIPEICRYCGGTVRLVPASMVYGAAAAKRLKLESEKFYQCQNCNARVGCHKGTTRPLGNLANEVLRLKRMETHQVYDAFWKRRGMTRTKAYKWLAEQLSFRRNGPISAVLRWISVKRSSTFVKNLNRRKPRNV